MEIIFTLEAKADLDDLRAFLALLSPGGLANVTAALEAKVRLVAENPNIGRSTLREGIREAVETKYGFLIPYWVNDNRLYVLRIYRSKRKPLDYEALNLN